MSGRPGGMRKVKWLKQLPGGGPYRQPGTIEENEGWLCERWVELGCAEFVDDDAKTLAEERADDKARREAHVPTPADEKTPAKGFVEDRVMRSKKGR